MINGELGGGLYLVSNITLRIMWMGIIASEAKGNELDISAGRDC